ncbi:MAG: agmatinase [marine bacterium B5-7]|nr:MAG: agmatinase [marine bacterium B5-7]
MSEDFASYGIFGNNFGYLGRPLSRGSKDADVAVLGVPYDMGTSGRAGTRHGPQGIRSASANLRWEERRWPWRFNLFDRLNVIDSGDLEFPTGESGKMVELLEAEAARHLEAGRVLLTLGGDHFITLPLLRAFSRHFGRPLRMIHFDAHTDTYSNDESRYDHGSMFYHAPREGILDAEHSVQIGIRTEYDYEDHPFTVIDAERFASMGIDKAIAEVREVVGTEPVYITFDIDCLDPAFAPGTGTPVAGGLSSIDALRMLRGFQGLNLVGMDIVEVAPSYDHAEITSLAAATLGLEFLYLLAAERGE